MSDRVCAAFLLILVAIAASSMIGATSADGRSDNSEIVSFRSVETEAGPMVEVSVGDVTFQTKEMTFIHEKSPNSRVSAVKHQIVAEWGESKLTATKVNVPLRNGFFSRARTGSFSASK